MPSGWPSSRVHSSSPGHATRTTWPRTGVSRRSPSSSRAPSPVAFTTRSAAAPGRRQVGELPGAQRHPGRGQPADQPGQVVGHPDRGHGEPVGVGVPGGQLVRREPARPGHGRGPGLVRQRGAAQLPAGAQPDPGAGPAGQLGQHRERRPGPAGDGLLREGPVRVPVRGGHRGHPGPRWVPAPDLDRVPGADQPVGAAQPDDTGPDDDDAHGPILPHRAAPVRFPGRATRFGRMSG